MNPSAAEASACVRRAANPIRAEIISVFVVCIYFAKCVRVGGSIQHTAQHVYLFS